MDVADWLRALGLERYEATFRENDVDAELLPNLTADDLKELGITSRRPSPPILEAIAALRLKDCRLMALFGCQPARPVILAVGDHRRTPPAHRDVLRPGGFDGAE